ncbi:MAG: HEAT repeat domain-containing protein [Candidatus Riflebacteria bacterium]|nr:HEAT repeat domain-containing protein [Candidatus Riflebacteria bacterium]
MNDVAQKRIKELREKITATVSNNLGANLSESTRARLNLLLAEAGLPQSEGIVFSYLQNHPEQEEAIIAGSKFAGEEIENFLIDLLKQQRSVHRDLIVEQLGFRKKAEMVAKLQPFLADSDRHVRFQTANALFNIGGKEAALALCEFISDPDEWISMTILRLLCIMRELDSIPILIEKYHQDEDLRRKALMISFLARFRSVTLLPIFDEGIKARDARLRANSIEAIGDLTLPPEEIKERVEKHLHDPNNRIRANVILALAKLEPEKIKPEIQEMAASNDVQLRRSAAFILGMIPSDEYHDLGAVLVGDKSEVVRKRMIQSLRNFSSEFVFNQLDLALSDQNKWIRKHAVDMATRLSKFPHKKILGLLKTERAAPNLESCLNFFTFHPTEEALTAIKLHLKDRRLPVVKALLAAVAAIGGVEGVKSIAPRLEQRDPQVIRALSEILIKAGERKILEDLVERFSQLKNETQVEALIPSLSSSLKILDLGDSMPVPLLKSFEKIEVADKPAPPPPPPQPEQTEEPEEFEEPVLPESVVGGRKAPIEAGGLEDLEEVEDADESESDASGEISDSDLPDLLSLGDFGDFGGGEPAKPKKAKPGKVVPKVSPHYRAGLKAYNVGKYKKAISEFSMLLETDESPPINIYLYMGIMCSEQDSYEQARDYLQTFIGKAPDHARAHYVLGKVYRQLKNWNDLIKVYEKFVGGEIEASPKMKTKIYHDLGVACVLVAKYERGAQLLDSLLKLHPDDAEVAYYLALANFQLGKISVAGQILHQACKLPVGNKRIGKLIEALSQKVRAGGH